MITKTIALMQQESKQTSNENIAELLARNKGYGGPIAQMLANSADLQKFLYAFALRNLREGWTPEQRKFYFQFVSGLRSKSGGSSYQGFINNMDKEAFDNCSDLERLAIEAAGLRKPFKVKELPKPQGPGRDWKLDELVQYAEPKLKGRDFKNGQKMFAAARCVICHRFNGEGGATGQDLSQVAGRYSLKDLGESILEPSKVISDQYRASVVATSSGKIYTGIDELLVGVEAGEALVVGDGELLAQLFLENAAGAGDLVGEHVGQGDNADVGPGVAGLGGGAGAAAPAADQPDLDDLVALGVNVRGGAEQGGAGGGRGRGLQELAAGGWGGVHGDLQAG